MLPDRCSMAEGGRRCQNPPEFVLSVVSDGAEYMVGVACRAHRGAVSDRIGALQEEGRLGRGSVSISPVRAVGTDCIRACPDDGCC
ncbi:MAG: hypothetical protein MPI95_03985 [Nitrosopumilus sp.]|nr:hypothetical protein [Nitrosopumilus sp.]CAI9831955.1 conserved hypothetical protein [Nitrosopumilaceae archaeon]MDA7941737.1 hypothetical protein [Nitrosopumilus sp.]MDA7943728.1 hypothetical protein [Nitrosopumilus sp.]MDA7945789.1 hypothetical protein [Nitrosopumilus sp.]